MSPDLILDAAALAATLLERLTGSPLAELASKLLGLLSAAWGATGKPPDEYAAWVERWRQEVRAQVAQDRAVEDEESKGPSA